MSWYDEREVIKTSDCSYQDFEDWKHSVAERRERFRYLLHRMDTERPEARYLHSWLGARNMLAKADDRCEVLWKKFQETGKLEDGQKYEDALHGAEEFSMDYALHVMLNVDFRKFREKEKCKSK